MSVHPPERKFLINWLKAFFVSPGVLFPAAYLALYLGTDIYLNTDYKKELFRSLSKAAGSASRIEIGTLHTCYKLDIITIDHINITFPAPVRGNESWNAGTSSISSVSVPVRNAEKLIFSTAARRSSLDMLCRQIIDREHQAH